MEYVSAADWHGWDKISIVVTDLGYDDVQPSNEGETHYLHISVAAINDAPVLEVGDFEAITIVDEESPSGDETTSAFLVPAQEDAVTVIAGVMVSDVDTKAEGLFLNRPDGFVATLSADGMGNGAEMLAVEPKIALSLSCTYGSLALGPESGGLVAGDGDLDGGGKMLSVTGKISNINAALVEGIIYTPSANWNGIDVVEVRLPAPKPNIWMQWTCYESHTARSMVGCYKVARVFSLNQVALYMVDHRKLSWGRNEKYSVISYTHFR